MDKPKFDWDSSIIMDKDKLNRNNSLVIDKKNYSVTIRPAYSTDEFIWREMWSSYNSFYGAKVPENITSATWTRIIDVSSSIGALLAISEGEIVGFANYVLHPYSWSEGFACLMDDLFIIPKARGKGAGGLLIQKLIDMGKENGWTRIYWMTKEGNATARILYDKFCEADGFVRYTMALDGIRPSGGYGE